MVPNNISKHCLSGPLNDHIGSMVSISVPTSRTKVKSLILYSYQLKISNPAGIEREASFTEKHSEMVNIRITSKTGLQFLHATSLGENNRVNGVTLLPPSTWQGAIALWRVNS